MDISTIIAGVLTIAILSFLYGDNPVYRFAESLLIGVSVGYAVVITWQNSIVDLLFKPLFTQNDYWLLLPAGLGLMMLGRFFRSTTALSRIPIAVLIGSGAGVSIPAMLDARIMTQVTATATSLATPDLLVLASTLVVVVGLLCSLSYFYFTREQTGALGVSSRIGIYFLMIFFGTTFGYTVMSRMSTFIGRMEFLVHDFFGLTR